MPGISTAEQEKLQFMLYPNPTNGNFIVESGGGRISLMSLDGRVLKEYELAEGKDKIELPQGIAAGMYMIKYRGPKTDKVLRLIYQP